MGDKAHLEATAESVLERRDGVRRTVARQDDLSTLLLDGVEGVEEFLLEAFLALHELDVVDQEHVVPAVAILEFWELFVSDGLDEPVHERLTGYVLHPVGRIVGGDIVADGLEEVGLAEAGVSVDEQRVVGPSGGLGYRLGGCVGEPVGRADHEVLEGEPTCERHVAGH